MILDVSILCPGSSLADLYDPDFIPVELAKVHQQLDQAVEKACGISFGFEEEHVAFFERYSELIKEGK